MSVSLYGGCFSLRVLSGILEADAERYYAAELAFLKDRRLIHDQGGGICRVTREGFFRYGAVAALFWSGRHRHFYLNDKEMTS